MRDGERLGRTVQAIAEDDYAARHAVAGWLYAARFESRFIEADLAPPPRDAAAIAHDAASHLAGDTAYVAEAASHLARIAAITDVTRLHAALEELVTLELAMHDGRGDGGGRAFRDDAALNVVVLGAGPIGLALASAIRVALGASADVLVVENRVAAPGRRRPYERRWLTAVGQDAFATIAEPSVRDLLAKVGTSHIGVTIDVLETLLYLSCVRSGVRFLFDARADLAFVGEQPVHLVFDATGNRLGGGGESRASAGGGVLGTATVTDGDVTVGPPIAIDSWAVNTDRLAAYGVDVTGSTAGAIHVATSGSVRYPLFEGRRIAQAMVKITQVPVRSCDALVELVRRDNHDNKHYVWRGSLRDENNHGLVIVNLARAEYEVLRAQAGPMPLASALASPPLRAALDPRSVALLALIAERSSESKLARVALERPFVWRPYWNTTRASTLHGAPLVRVGDSIYSGNVKLANGLGPHLRHVAHVQRQLWQLATARHATRIAGALGLARTRE